MRQYLRMSQIRNGLIYILLIFFISWGASMVMAKSQPVVPRAIWIWENDAFRMLDDPKVQQDVETFLLNHHITTLYLYADEYKKRHILLTQPDKYRKLIANAHARGFKVYALLGSSYLYTQAYILPEKRAAALQMFQNVLDFNKNTSDPGAQFDGINLDLEPYLLDDWSTARPLRGKQYLSLSADFMRLKAASGLKLEVGPAMPFWYDGITDVEWNGHYRPLNEDVQDIYDYVALMDYRNVALGSDSIVSLAENEIAYADKIDKKIIIGVEMGDSTPAKITFFGKSQHYFESQLEQARDVMAAHPSFGGFAIDHLTPYRDLVGKNP